MARRADDYLLSILVPVFNEEKNVGVLCSQVMRHIDPAARSEIIFVDDGSRDGTLDELKKLRLQHDNVHYLALSRNFGHQSALKAGLDACSGDVVISMDGDRQHPPGLIPKMIERWRDGSDVVITTREDADASEGLFKRITSSGFYWLFNRMSDVELKPGSADFRLLDRKVVEALREMRESDVFLRGHVAWSGFEQAEIRYTSDRRSAGGTKYTFGKMVRLAVGALVGFSVLPLRAVIVAGLATSLASFGYGLYAVLIRLFTDQAVSGWSSIMAGVYFLGGIQLVCIGVCGEYIGRVFAQVKERPLYIVREAALPSAESRR